MQRKTKKYNRQTGGYKIDIFYDGNYLCSTDWHKTCKEAKENYVKGRNNDRNLTPGRKLVQSEGFDPNKLKAFFDYQ